jgi:hypothetical protein
MVQIYNIFSNTKNSMEIILKNNQEPQKILSPDTLHLKEALNGLPKGMRAFFFNRMRCLLRLCACCLRQRIFIYRVLQNPHLGVFYEI